MPIGPPSKTGKPVPAIGNSLTIWVDYRPEQFRLLKGSLAPFSETPGVCEPSAPGAGTSIGYSDQGLEGELYLTIGSFDHPERLGG